MQADWRNWRILASVLVAAFSAVGFGLSLQQELSVDPAWISHKSRAFIEAEIHETCTTLGAALSCGEPRFLGKRSWIGTASVAISDKSAQVNFVQFLVSRGWQVQRLGDENAGVLLCKDYYSARLYRDRSAGPVFQIIAGGHHSPCIVQQGL